MPPVPGLPQFIQDHALGHSFEDADVTVFFGDARSERVAVEAAFPDFTLSILNQTHSDIAVAAPFVVPPREADAQFTRQRRLALCVRTADCVPVMIHDPSTQMIAAAHAGWRGVENEIVRKLCNRMTAEGAMLDHARAWIGPHIGASSFEVGLDVGARLEARFEAVRGFSPESSVLLPHDDAMKVRVNLLAIVRAQLEAAGIEDESVLELPIDTVASSDHQSFRRDRDRAGRQISFIAFK